VGIKQLSDDGIDGFISDLVDYLENHPATFEGGRVTDEGYDNLEAFVYSKLQCYSNGYKNHN